MPQRFRLSRRVVFTILAAAALSRSSAAQEIVLSPNLANQLRQNLNVSLAAGRVVALGRFEGRSLNWSTQSGENREQMKIDLTGPNPSIDYELSTAEFKIVLELDDGRALRIRRLPQGTGQAKFLEFVQPAEGDLKIVVGQNPPEKSWTFASVWHLLIAEPELVRTEVEPLLRLLRPGWPLASEGQAIEAALYKQVDAERSYDRQAWASLVEKLRSQHYVERIEADRQLRELGQVIVPYLQHLSPQQLDAEQAYRIRMIVRSHGTERAEDSPETAATWLAADPEVWYSLARRASGSQRTKAALQLGLLLGEPVQLDPAAAGASLDEQLTKIRGQIDRLHPRGK
jgi:hypothetical protein